MQRYENIQFKQKYSIKLIEEFFKKFPEERRGRKKFREKEIQNTKILIYEKILQKGLKIKADCVGSIKEKVDKELIIITKKGLVTRSQFILAKSFLVWSGFVALSHFSLSQFHFYTFIFTLPLSHFNFYFHTFTFTLSHSCFHTFLFAL